MIQVRGPVTTDPVLVMRKRPPDRAAVFVTLDASTLFGGRDEQQSVGTAGAGIGDLAQRRVRQ
jgi:hypothetical protein